MPFTISHAVVALPFVRTPLVPAAVAVGAMTPDVPLFVGPIVPDYGMTHSFAWMPVTMVLALVILLVWRCVVRPAARELSPQWLARRVPTGWDGGARAALRETFRTVRGTVWLLLALAVGIASHIAWDLFTHEGRWGVAIVPALGQQWGPLLGVKWLQYASSVIGLAVLLWWLARWIAKQRPVAQVARILPSPVRWAWWISLPVILAIAAIAFAPFTIEVTATAIAYRALVPATGAWAAASLALCGAVQLARSFRTPDTRKSTSYQGH